MIEPESAADDIARGLIRSAIAALSDLLTRHTAQRPIAPPKPLGACIKGACRRRAKAGYVQCTKHLEIVRINSAKYRAYQKRHGLCVRARCENLPEDGLKTCYKCAMTNRRACRRYTAARKKAKAHEG
jgi:hypothetical protein